MRIKGGGQKREKEREPLTERETETGGRNGTGRKETKENKQERSEFMGCSMC